MLLLADGDTNFSERERRGTSSCFSLSRAGVNYVLFLETLNLKLGTFLNVILRVVGRSHGHVLFFCFNFFGQ